MADTYSTPAQSAPDNPAASPAPSPSPSPGETPAPSPSATPSAEPQGETRESLLDVVQKAVNEPRPSQRQQDEPGGVSPAPTAKPDQTAAAQAEPPRAEDDLPDEITQEELARYHPSAKRRVEKLLKQRNDARAQYEGQAAELSRLKSTEPQAQAAASVQQYLRDNDIGRDDFLLTLELAAAMRRGDFKTFYEGVQPYVKLAEEYLGVSLPADLQQRVREGHMTTQAAQMFSRERMDRALADSQRLRQAQRFDQTTRQSAVHNLADAVEAHVNAWEAAIKQSDPDYAAKKPLLQDVMWSVVRERGAPQSPEQAVEIAKIAYQRVNEHAARWAPPKRPTSRNPSSTGRTNGAAPEPKTLTEVVQQAMERARA